MMTGKESVIRERALCKGTRRTGIAVAAVILVCLGINICGMLFLIEEYRRSNAYWGAVPVQMILISAAVILVTAGGFLFVWRAPRTYGQARIAELTDYLEQINVGGTGAVLVTKEDEFSHLQDEMYKTVTELYHTREQAVLAKENYAENLANIAHQLKTPVTAALLSLQLLQEQTGGRAEVTESKYEEAKRSTDSAHQGKLSGHLCQIGGQLERLQRLEEALLTLSRIDAGTLKLEKTQVDIYTVLSLAEDNLAGLLAQRGISVDIPDKGSIVFLGDMEWTMEAVMNLMKNCMEHAPAGSTIHCDYSANPLYREILIWDEGGGFAKEELPHLFERFYRGQRNGKEEKRGRSTVSELPEINNDTGVGIGLSLARSILELQNGTISARNLPQGGACFEIKLYCH